MKIGMNEINRGRLGKFSALSVAQVSKPAVSPISKSADRLHVERVSLSNDLRVWKPAIRQTWKSALRLRPAARASALAAFTLIEIMVVVVILGILAATIIPQFMGTTQDAKISAAKSQVAELESALERFYVHMDRYPTTEEGLNVLVTAPPGDEAKWRGPYIKMLRADPWGNPYQYVFPGTHHATSFDLWSRGADGQDGGEGANADIGNW